MPAESGASVDAFSVDLTGRVAFVTGASSGLGARFARVLAGAGAAVALAGRRLVRLQSLAEEIRATGGIAEPIMLDVRNANALSSAVDLAEVRLGLVDILVNNAGMAGKPTSTEPDLDDIDAVLATNIRAPYLLCMEVGRRLKAAGRPGNIVNIASIGALSYVAGPGAVLYCATKAAVIRMTETLSVEWARDQVNVNAIAPGLFRSEMSADYFERVGTRAIEKLPRGRVGEPHQLDSTLLYLVCSGSAAVTGACVRVTDGQNPI